MPKSTRTVDSFSSSDYEYRRKQRKIDDLEDKNQELKKQNEELFEEYKKLKSDFFEVIRKIRDRIDSL